MAALPKLLVGPRRRLMALLIGTSAGLAALSGASAYLMAHLLRTDSQGRILAIAALLAVAAGIGIGRFAERVLAEKLGQHYVQELRTGLIAAYLAEGRGPSPGITIARVTNDLTSVRNWITMGITPLIVGVPLAVGTIIALWLLSPPLALAVAIPACLLTAILAVLSKPAYTRARALRKKRGRLAAQVSDMVAAAATVRAAAGERREVQQIERLGGDVAAAAIARARIGGCIRGSATFCGAVTGLSVAATGSWLSIHTATIGAALSVVGLLATHVNDFGRVAEYRQTFNAAKRIIGPALVPVLPGQSREAKPPVCPDDGNPVQAGAGKETGVLVRVSGLKSPSNQPLPDLNARAGDRIVLQSSEPGAATEVFGMLLTVRTNPQLDIWVDGHYLRSEPGTERRRLTGYAGQGGFIERGTIARAVRYRRPDLAPELTAEALARVGLSSRVAGLPRAEHTVLRRGGEPLTISERARLQIARAVFGDPPLLLLNHIDFDLGAEGRPVLAQILRHYPGVAIMATEHPELLVPEYAVWDLR
ncbi:ABC transporter transmembrane domain-containing protein [Arthrobacter sp. NPDC058097]|uniref:ABC transporter transmembrane domain-containing protein n=1 Tax=Arthrobacter sp. NPDC058097 TaxID=3346340 RepID=UPI0036D9E685